MDWWIWLVIAVAALIVLAVSTMSVQARRRSGGVIAVKRHGGRRGRRMGLK